MPTISSNYGQADIYESLERDKYGRRVRHYSVAGDRHRTKVVVVTLPKVATELNGGLKYLVNDWQMPVWVDGVNVGDAPGKITYLRTLKQARALVASKIAV